MDLDKILMLLSYSFQARKFFEIFFNIFSRLLLIHSFRFPFDWQTPSGFLASAFTESLSASLTAELFFDTLALTAGFCLYASEFVNDLEEMVRDLNENLITDGDGKLIAAVSMETKKKLIEIIRFHSEIVELSVTFYHAK